MSSLKNFKYSRLSKFLHRLMFISTDISKIFFEIEKQIFLKKINNSKISSFFITGLPRSGSTILLNSLHKTNYFSSLQYSDMPFITSPNLWSKLNFFKEINKTHERAHKDGIRIGFNSPEAFEEVFWKSQLSFKNKDPLIFDASDYTNKVIKNFENFVKLISFKNRKKFYLSKNNNNIIRVEFLQKKVKFKKILILFRDPLEQSCSMLNQHINFNNLQNSDKFILEYMNFLSHYEFGLNHKPFLLSKFDTNLKNDNINYWLSYWIMIYSNLLKHKNYNDICFLSYEKLVRHPEETILKILKMLNINEKNLKNEIFQKKKSYNCTGMDRETLIEANNLYDQIKKYEI